MGHEYCGIVEDVGSAVRSIRPGQFVIGSFFSSDNTCPHCRAGYQTSCSAAPSWSVAHKRRSCAFRLQTAPWSATPDAPRGGHDSNAADAFRM